MGAKPQQGSIASEPGHSHTSRAIGPMWSLSADRIPHSGESILVKP